MGEFHVCEDLCFVNWGNGFNGLQLHNNLTFDEKVNTVSKFEPDLLVDHGYRNLPFNMNIAFHQLKHQAFFIRGF